MGQIIQIENIGNLNVIANDQMQFDPSIVNLGGQQYQNESPLICDTTVSGIGGIDTGLVAGDTLYHVFYVLVGTIIGLVMSKNYDAPVGFDNYKKVGRTATDAIGVLLLAISFDKNEQFNKLKIGSEDDAPLTEMQYQVINGIDWVLQDGQDVTGSLYHKFTGNANVPDALGCITRGKNNGRSDGQENPDGELALGTYQADMHKSHTHTHNDYYSCDGYHGGTYRNQEAEGGDGGKCANRTVATGNPHTYGNAESRMNCTITNFFMKIN